MALNEFNFESWKYVPMQVAVNRKCLSFQVIPTVPFVHRGTSKSIRRIISVRRNACRTPLTCPGHVLCNWGGTDFGSRFDEKGNEASSFGTSLSDLLGDKGINYRSVQLNSISQALKSFTLNTRLGYGASSTAITLPISREIDAGLLSTILSFLKYPYDSEATNTSPLSSPDVNVITVKAFLRHIEEDLDKLRKALRIASKAETAWQNVLKAMYTEDNTMSGKWSSAHMLSVLYNAIPGRVEVGLINEMETTTLSSGVMGVEAHLFVTPLVGMLYGERIYARKQVKIKCTPAFATSVCTVARKELFIERVVCEKAIVGSSDIDTTNEVDNARNHRSQPDEKLKRPIYSFSAEEIFHMNDDAIRELLAGSNVPVTSSEIRESLLSKLSPLMDEVERREMAIMLAAVAEDYALAAKLQKKRSKRGELTILMKEAQERGDWGAAFNLKVQMDRLKIQTADFTADPGDYDPYLDQDEWYNPVR